MGFIPEISRYIHNRHEGEVQDDILTSIPRNFLLFGETRKMLAKIF